MHKQIMDNVHIDQFVYLNTTGFDPTISNINVLNVT